jgi:predicted RecB family nuclease
MFAATPVRVGDALGIREASAFGIVARARAVHLQRPVAIAPLALPAGRRVYVDVETNLEQSRIWMIGALCETTGEFIQPYAHSFHARYERPMLEAFVAFLAARPDAIVVHYSGTDFDGRMLRKVLDLYGLPVPAVLVDALPYVRRAIAPPGGRYALKEIGKSAGYHFRHPTLDGLWVASHYMARVPRRVRNPVTPAMHEYAEDDVRSLPHILGWAAQHCGVERAAPPVGRRGG